MKLPKEKDTQNLTGRPHPCGDTQINRNELIKDISHLKICLSYWPNNVVINVVSA